MNVGESVGVDKVGEEDGRSVGLGDVGADVGVAVGDPVGVAVKQHVVLQSSAIAESVEQSPSNAN